MKILVITGSKSLTYKTTLELAVKSLFKIYWFKSHLLTWTMIALVKITSGECSSSLFTSGCWNSLPGNRNKDWERLIAMNAMCCDTSRFCKLSMMLKEDWQRTPRSYRKWWCWIYRWHLSFWVSTAPMVHHVVREILEMLFFWWDVKLRSWPIVSHLKISW